MSAAAKLYCEINRDFDRDASFIANVLLSCNKPTTRIRNLLMHLRNGKQFTCLSFRMPYEGFFVDGQWPRPYVNRSIQSMIPTLRQNGKWMATIRIEMTIGRRHLVAAVMDSGSVVTNRKQLFHLVRMYIEENGTEHVNDNDYWDQFDSRDYSDAEDIVFKLAPEFWGC